MSYQPEDLFAHLAGFAEREAHAHHEDHQQRYDQPIDTRVASGTALSGLYFRGRESRPDFGDCLVFAASHNESRLRPGSRLRLSRGDPRQPAAKVELIDDRFDGEQYILGLRPGEWVIFA